MTDFQRKSWIPVAPDSDFPLQNLPYGIFSAPGLPPQAGIAIGDQILILDRLAVLGHLDDLALPANIFAQETLNEFIALGKPYWKALRQKLSDLLSEDNDTLQPEQEHLFVAQAEAQMHLPVKIGDYTDFYSSIEHATNVGTMFR
ncbi:MAG: fumarylacetoacetase, partial [Bacteroidota bacterium]